MWPNVKFSILGVQYVVIATKRDSVKDDKTKIINNFVRLNRKNFIKIESK